MLKIISGYRESIFTYSIKVLYTGIPFVKPSLTFLIIENNYFFVVIFVYNLFRIVPVECLWNHCLYQCPIQRISIFSLKRIHNQVDKMTLWAGSFVLKHLWRSFVKLVFLFFHNFLLFFQACFVHVHPCIPEFMPILAQNLNPEYIRSDWIFLFTGLSRGSVVDPDWILIQIGSMDPNQGRSK